MNRNMEAKRIKYIRQSRARPRTLRMNNGHQRVPQSVDRSKIPQEYMGLFAYRERAKTFVDDFLEAKFPSHCQESTERKLAKAYEAIEPPEAPNFKSLILDGRYRKVVIISDTALQCIQFIEFQVLPSLMRRSVTYNNYDRAMECLQRDDVKWKDSVQIPSVE